MHSLVHDLRFTLRLVRKHPGMTCLVIAALVLGIGVNSAVFSVVHCVLLKPVEISDPDRVAFVFAKSSESSFMSVSYPEYQDWKAQSRIFEKMAAYEPVLFNLKLDGHPEALSGFRTTASAFDTFGIAPLLGRKFVASDEVRGATPVAVISNGLWKRRFGGDPSVIGKTILLQAQPYAVVGVFPQTDLPLIGDVWVDIGPFLNDKLMNRETRRFFVAGRMTGSADIAQAQKEMDVVAARLATQFPKSNKNMEVNVAGLTELFMSNVRRPLTLIGIASGLVLLLAAVNVLSVFIASTLERRKELSIRLALGATRSIVVRQLVVQSFLFAVVGAGLGLLAAKVGLAYLVKSFPLSIVRFQETTIDETVVWFTILLAVGSTILSSVLPGLYITKLNVNSELKSERIWTPPFRYRQAGASALIVFEVGLAVGLSLVSGLLIKSFYEIEKVDLGFDPHDVLTFEIWLPETEYKDDASKATFCERALNNLRAVPGVRSASASFTLPAATSTHIINLQVDSDSPQSSERPLVDSNMVTPGFLTILKTPILQGRDFTGRDNAGAPPVAIVDEVLAARMWPGQSPLGKRLRLADITDNGPPWREIVGIVRQVKYFGPERNIERPQVYEPLIQHPPPFISFVMNTPEPIETVRAPVEKAIHELAPDLPLQYFQTLDEFVDKKESRRKISLLLLSGFAAIGIVLGVIGIYAVVANSVVRRRREMAIRMALGASARNAIFAITKLILLAGIAGMAVGLVLVISLKGVLGSFLFGVKPLDPQVYFLTITSIAVLTVIAALVPAAGLLRLNPQDILRE